MYDPNEVDTPPSNPLRSLVQYSFLELVDGFEPATCGLRITPSTTSDNLTPQETTKEESGTVGADGESLSCTGSRVVAEID